MENLICSRVSVFLFVFVVAFFVLAVRSWEWGGLDWESLGLRGLDWEPNWGELAGTGSPLMPLGPLVCLNAFFGMRKAHLGKQGGGNG